MTQFFLGFTAALVLVVGVFVLRIPFPHRARSPERLEHLIRELYSRGEQGAYANVVYRLGRASGGVIRLTKTIEAVDQVGLSFSLPENATDVRVSTWIGTQSGPLGPDVAARALTELLVHTLAVDLRKVVVIYSGLNPSSARIGWSH